MATQQADTRVINGVVYRVEKDDSQANVKKLTELPVNVPYSWLLMGLKPTRYGSFVVDIKNLDNYEECKCYMPAYVVNRGGKGKVFVYEGLVKKTDGSGQLLQGGIFRAAIGISIFNVIIPKKE